MNPLSQAKHCSTIQRFWLAGTSITLGPAGGRDLTGAATFVSVQVHGRFRPKETCLIIPVTFRWLRANSIAVGRLTNRGV
jgi:hypothetical protein